MSYHNGFQPIFAPDSKATKDKLIRDRLLRTFRRFEIAKETTFQDVLDNWKKTTLDNFGTAGSMYASPKQLEDFKGLSEQLKKDKK